MLARPAQRDQLCVAWGFVAAALWIAVSLVSGGPLPMPSGCLVGVTLLLAAIAAIDARWGLVPDELLVGLATIGLLDLAQGTPLSLWGGRLGSAVLILLLGIAMRILAQRPIGREALGFGDVKLIAVATLFLGLPGLAFMLPLGIASALISGVLLRRMEGRWPDTLPLGPHIGLALLWTLLLGLGP